MITVLGSTNVDQIGRVEHLPKIGQTVPGTSFSMSAGGKGANQALAARRAGSIVRHVSAVGSDAFAEVALAELRAAGVDIEAIEAGQQHTGIAMILVDANGENSIAVLPGANLNIGEHHGELAVDGMSHGDVLLVQQEIPQSATAAGLELARRKGVTSILNTAPCLPDTRDIAPLASVIVANEGEFCELADCSMADLETAMLKWATSYGQTVVVTLGSQGAFAAQDGRLLKVPALDIKPLDTVGAGDTFCGYFADSLSRGHLLSHATRRATVAASLACLYPGAQPAIPSATEVESRLEGERTHG